MREPTVETTETYEGYPEGCGPGPAPPSILVCVTCGDGTCGAGESPCNCAADCPDACGDGEYCSLVTRSCRPARFERTLSRASRSGTIALTPTGERLAVVRPDAGALGLLPFYVAQRATATRVGKVDIP